MIEYIEVFVIAMLKYLFAFPLAATHKLNFFIALVTCSSGMMTTVLIITFFSSTIKRFIFKIYFNKRNKFNKTNRRIVKIYSKFGIWGIALITPPILTPIGGTLVAVARGENKQRIIFAMFVSSLIWGICWGAFIYFIGDKISTVLHNI